MLLINYQERTVSVVCENPENRKEAVQKLESDMISKYGSWPVEQAKVYLMIHGQANFNDASWVATFRQNLHDKNAPMEVGLGEFSYPFIDCAAEIAAWTRDPMHDIGELQIFCHPDSAIDRDDGSSCPVCHSELKLSDDQVTKDNGKMVAWVCPGCGTTGEQWSKTIFESHRNVVDANGNGVYLP